MNARRARDAARESAQTTEQERCAQGAVTARDDATAPSDVTPRRPTTGQRLLRLLVLAVALWGLGSIALGEALLRPDSPPAPDDSALEEYALLAFLDSVEGVWVPSWVVEPKHTPARGTVLLLHGLDGVRRVSDHRLLLERGWRVVSLDFRGHGGSRRRFAGDEGSDSGLLSGFGWHERAEVEFGLKLIEKRWPHQPLVGWGRSLGAAALLFALQDRRAAGEPQPFDALLLEACYTDFDTAFENRLRLHLGSAAWRPLFAITEAWVRWRGDLPVERMSPLAALPDAVARPPLLFARGELDEHMSAAEAEAWRRAAPEAAAVLVPDHGHQPLSGAPVFRAELDRLLSAASRTVLLDTLFDGAPQVLGADGAPTPAPSLEDTRAPPDER